MPSWLILSYAFVIGAVVGSFLNVCIHRWPLGQSVVRPRSRCPGCGNPIAWYDNVPLVQTGIGTLVAWLRHHRFAIHGADAAGTAVERLEAPARVALVLGNEGAGIGAEVRAALDALVAIPIRGGAESLNVGVAAGILLYLLTRSR